MVNPEPKVIGRRWCKTFSNIHSRNFCFTEEVHPGVFKDLFHPNHLMNTKEDAANNYARGQRNPPVVVECLRKLVEPRTASNVSLCFIRSAVEPGQVSQHC
jgi:hypothetical protein